MVGFTHGVMCLWTHYTFILVLATWHSLYKCQKCENGNIRCCFPRMLLASIFKYSVPFLKWGTHLYKEVLLNDSRFMEPSTTPVSLSLLIQVSTPCTNSHWLQSFCCFHCGHKYWCVCSLSQFVPWSDDIMCEEQDYSRPSLPLFLSPFHGLKRPYQRWCGGCVLAH